MPGQPRHHPENNNYVTIPATFKEYKNEYKLRKIEFILIVKTFFMLFAKSMIYEAKTFIIPKGLGSIGIRKQPTHGRGVFDYQLYRTTGIKRWHYNKHSEQFTTILYWNQHSSRLKDQLTCTFKMAPNRLFSRELAQHIKTTNAINKYYDR